MIRFYEVGGCVRDEIMGVQSKDIDFAVETHSFEHMEKVLTERGFKIFQSKPEFFTVRAMFPKGHQHEGTVADFVLCRKDGPSADGRRPDFVEAGTIEDDLARRDFTMNAIAKRNGEFIDPFGGRADIEAGIIRCVGNAEDRLREDALRGLRAMRFAVTKGFKIDHEIRYILTRPWFAELLTSVSKERQREEMEKMFAHDTLAAIQMIGDDQFWPVREAVFSNGLRLSATMKA